MIRAGKKGSAHDLFMTGLVALEDAHMKDLSKLKSTRDAFYEKYRKKHSEESRSGSAGIAGKFFRFANEINLKDIVLYPCRLDKAVYIGEISGQYSFEPTSDFPHQRKVKWNWVEPKSSFEIQTQYELGAARTLFEFKKNLPEVLSLVAAETLPAFTLENAPAQPKRQSRSAK